MGNIEVLKRGDTQLTSAGTGIGHSEKVHGDKPFPPDLESPIHLETPTNFTRSVLLSFHLIV
jgi:redox-sensitive bicupin YhaK (pirin superfamily)